MDEDQDSSPTGLSSVPAAGTVRRPRGSIAAQACETCRNRRQRCDEQRPRCSTCQRMGVECNYREPIATKKDKTLVEILERLKVVDAKVDDFNSTRDSMEHARSSLEAALHLISVQHLDGKVPRGSQPSGLPTNDDNQIEYGTPSLYSSSVSRILKSSAFSQLMHAQPSLLEAIGTPLVGASDGPPRSFLEHERMIGPGNGSSGRPGRTDIQQDEQGRHAPKDLVKAYFETFHVLSPILDQQHFIENTVPSAKENNNSPGAVVTFLVFALGEVALRQSNGQSPLYSRGTPSSEMPAGFYFFTEARKRMGFAITDISPENVQMLCLAAQYCGFLGRLKSVWRMMASAISACQLLIFVNNAEPVEDAERRATASRLFWHCKLMETSLNMEFNLQIMGLKDTSLNGDYGIGPGQERFGNTGDNDAQLRVCEISLHRIATNCDFILRRAFAQPPRPGGLNHEGPIPTTARQVIAARELSLQLQSWRDSLSGHLQWDDDFPMTSQPPLWSPTQIAPNDQFMPAGLNSPGAGVSTMHDLHVALLRSKYYYLCHMVHRPFLLKALERKDGMGQEDAKAAAECLISSLRWPIADLALAGKRQFVPLTCFWSQNLGGILILLRMAQLDPLLAEVQTTFCGPRFNADLEETMPLYISWLREFQEVDSTAKWYWQVVKTLYGVED